MQLNVKSLATNEQSWECILTKWCGVAIHVQELT